MDKVLKSKTIEEIAFDAASQTLKNKKYKTNKGSR